ncbi:hypothetical protein PM082_015759 [Marasmius tenuissimus]|nr:hypothetical protein PM082_015759 [Marasmius tenuissimus]
MIPSSSPRARCRRQTVLRNHGSSPFSTTENRGGIDGAQVGSISMLALVHLARECLPAVMMGDLSSMLRSQGQVQRRLRGRL